MVIEDFQDLSIHLANATTERVRRWRVIRLDLCSKRCMSEHASQARFHWCLASLFYCNESVCQTIWKRACRIRWNINNNERYVHDARLRNTSIVIITQDSGIVMRSLLDMSGYVFVCWQTIVVAIACIAYTQNRSQLNLCAGMCRCRPFAKCMQCVCVCYVWV